MSTILISFPLISGVIAGTMMGLVVVGFLYFFQRASAFWYFMAFLVILFFGIIPQKYLESYWQVPEGSVCLSYVAVLFVYIVADLVNTVKLIYRRRRAKQVLREKIANAKIVYADGDDDFPGCYGNGIEEEL